MITMILEFIEDDYYISPELKEIIELYQSFGIHVMLHGNDVYSNHVISSSTYLGSIVKF